MSGAGDSLDIDQQAVTEVAERIPVRHGDAARRATAGLPVGQLFGNSPAARSLAETWRLTVDHHRMVTERLEQDLVELRRALHAVVDNTAAAEAESAARYNRAVEDFATVAEQGATELEGSSEEFRATHESDVAEELAQEHRAQSAVVEGPAAQNGAADSAADDVDVPAAAETNLSGGAEPAAGSSAPGESVLDG